MRKIFTAICTCLLAILCGCSALTQPDHTVSPALAAPAAVSVAQSSSSVQALTSAQSTPANVSYYFPRGGGDAEGALINVISSANHSLDIAIYSFTDQKVADAVLSARSRGVSVRVITDKQESGGKYQKKVLQKLISDSIPVRINTHKGLMHLKVSIADNSTVTTGSFNYTTGAQENNDEVFVVMNSRTAAADFDSQFERMWKDQNNFRDYH